LGAGEFGAALILDVPSRNRQVPLGSELVELIASAVGVLLVEARR